MLLYNFIIVELKFVLQGNILQHLDTSHKNENCDTAMFTVFILSLFILFMFVAMITECE